MDSYVTVNCMILLSVATHKHIPSIYIDYISHQPMTTTHQMLMTAHMEVLIILQTIWYISEIHIASRPKYKPNGELGLTMHACRHACPIN
jgi:hypothetical protein